jgi:hypothetical protein
MDPGKCGYADEDELAEAHEQCDHTLSKEIVCLSQSYTYMKTCQVNIGESQLVKNLISAG